MMGKGRSWGNVKKEETAMYAEKEKGEMLFLKNISLDKEKRQAVVIF